MEILLLTWSFQLVIRLTAAKQPIRKRQKIQFFLFFKLENKWKQAQNLCIDASVAQRHTKVNKGKQCQGLFKSIKTLRTFESYEKV